VPTTRTGGCPQTTFRGPGALHLRPKSPCASIIGVTRSTNSKMRITLSVRRATKGEMKRDALFACCEASELLDEQDLGMSRNGKVRTTPRRYRGSTVPKWFRDSHSLETVERRGLVTLSVWHNRQHQMQRSSVPVRTVASEPMGERGVWIPGQRQAGQVSTQQKRQWARERRRRGGDPRGLISIGGLAIDTRLASTVATGCAASSDLSREKLIRCCVSRR
jgi:hypothetical protein